MTVTDRRTSALVALAAGLAASPALATLPPAPPGVQVSVEYGQEFVTVTHAGNRYANQQEAPGLYDYTPPAQWGGVGYEYRIARTEVTNGQWLEFVRAFEPYYAGNRLASSFTGNAIYPTNVVGPLPPQYTMDPASAPYATTMAWEWAARYCNWLTNGKATTRASFESGAYDLTQATGTATRWASLPPRQPGARFWIPSADEWTKAAFYDPDRYGPGQEGFWTYHYGLSGPGVSGYPEDGGQTDAGIPIGQATRLNPVGAYGLMPPWGLLDTSGGVQEFTDSSTGYMDDVLILGSGMFQADPARVNRIDFLDAHGARVGGAAGLRLAAAVPAPATVTSTLVVMGCFLRRRR
jgi:formylglycine-generating enzyme required for sulfatase activity